MKISIVTPSLNSKDFIEDAIQSVLRQRYHDFEHIVVDGGSKDGTQEILRRYAHVKWISEPDKGQSDALNKGVSMSNGDVIGWLNADEYYLPGAFTDVEDFLRKEPEAEMVYGCCIFVDSIGRFQRLKWEHKFDPKILLYYGCHIPSCATFFNSRMVKENPLDVAYDYVMDFEYFLRLASQGRVIRFLEKPLSAFRWHDSNKSRVTPHRTKLELRRVQHKWTGFNSSDRIFSALALIYKAKRILLKTLNRGYWKETVAKSYRNRDTRWFFSEEASECC